MAFGIAAAVQATVITDENFNGALSTTDWTFSGGATNDGVESVISGTAGGDSLNLDRTADGLPQARNDISGISGDDVVISQPGLDFRTDVGTYDELRWIYNTTATGSDGQFYIDNVVVETIPEPATMGLIIGSAVVLLGVRRLQY